MKKFSITLNNKRYQIELQHNRTFKVMQKDAPLGTIYPSAGQLCLVWKSKDALEPELVNHLGQLIEAEVGSPSL